MHLDRTMLCFIKPSMSRQNIGSLPSRLRPPHQFGVPRCPQWPAAAPPRRFPDERYIYIYGKRARMNVLLAGALLWLAPPCGSWVFLSRGSTGRSRTRPRGSKRYDNVKRANRLCRRMLYLAEYARAKGIHIVLEQPFSSLLPLYPPVRRFLRRHAAQSLQVSLGAWGAASEKLGLTWDMYLNIHTKN